MSNGILKAIKDWCNEKFQSKGNFLERLANNLLTTEEGFALDARQGTVLQGEIDEINSNLDNIITAKPSTTTVTLNVGYNTINLIKPEIPDGYRLLTCINVSTSTTQKVAIYATSPNGSVRVWNDTSMERDVTFTTTWLLVKL